MFKLLRRQVAGIKNTVESLSPLAIQQALDDLYHAFTKLEKNPTIDGVLLEDVTVSASMNLSHKLGRPPRGLYIAKTNNTLPVAVWATSQPRPNSELAITFTSVPADTRASFYIF